MYVNEFLKGTENMQKLIKFTSLFLALIMSVSALCMTTPVMAATGYEYNVYANAIVVNAENGAINLDDASTQMIAQAKTVGASAIIFNAGKLSSVTVSINDAILSGIADGEYPVRILLSSGKAFLNPEAVKELSDKVSGKLELVISLGSKAVVSIKADGAAVVLNTPVLVTADNAVDGATTANIGGKPFGAAYVEGGKWGFLTNTDTTLELTKTQSPTFDDVSKRHWAKENIAFVTTTGYFNGVAPGKFNPDGKMTRAMVVTVLSRIDGFNGAAGSYPYKDVAANAWFAPAVTWAYNNGIVEAGDSFRPDDNVTRIELMQMLYNFAKKLGIVNSADLEGEVVAMDIADIADEEGKNATLFCTSNGIVTGYTTGSGNIYIRPANTALRSEVSAMIQRFIKHAILGGGTQMKGKYSDFINLRGNLNNVYNKLINEKELTVSYLGGSVTGGHGSSSEATRWRTLTHKWIKDNFPNANVIMNNAHLGSSGSHLGAYKIQTEVIPQGTDLLFIEFAVNDAYKKTYQEGKSGFYYESIIRQIREALPECEIVSVYVTNTSWLKQYGLNIAPVPAEFEKVCDYYGVSSVDSGRALAKEIGTYNETVAKTYLPDGVHASDAGYKVYSDAIIEFLSEALLGETSLNYGDIKNYSISDECLNEDVAHFVPKYVPIDSLEIFDDIKGFQFFDAYCETLNAKSKGYIVPAAADNKLTYTFEGTGLDMFLKFNGERGSYYYEYTIDGGEPKKVLLPSGQNYPFNFISGLEPGKHTITYSYLGPDGEGEAAAFDRPIAALLVKGYKD